MRFDDPHAFGNVIRQIRKAQNMTQSDLAAACGTGVRFIVDLERGKPTCELGRALRVAQMLGIQLNANSPDVEQDDG